MQFDAIPGTLLVHNEYDEFDLIITVCDHYTVMRVTPFKNGTVQIFTITTQSARKLLHKTFDWSKL